MGGLMVVEGPRHCHKVALPSTMVCCAQANWRQTALALLQRAGGVCVGKVDPPPPSSVGTAAADSRRHCPDDFAIEAAGRALRPVDELQSSFLYRRWCRSVCLCVWGGGGVGGAFRLSPALSLTARACVPVPALVHVSVWGETSR